jgi:hypothetical protein
MATAIDSPQTRDVLRSLGCLKEESLDNERFAILLAQRLESDHVAASLEDVSTVEVTAGHLIGAIVGHSDEQLVEIAKPLLVGGAGGLVQRALSDGHILCAKRARIKLDIDGEIQWTQISTRFLSNDPDVLDKYVLDPRDRRAKAFAANTRKLVGLIEHRVPAMQPRLTSFLDQLQITFTKELEGS